MGSIDRFTNADRGVAQALAVAVLGVVAGAVAASFAISPAVPLVILMTVVTLSPLFVRLAQRKFDPFEPIMIIMVTFFILFPMRAAAEQIYGIKQFLGQYTAGGFVGASLISVIGISAVYAGYALGAGRWIAKRVKALPPTYDTDRSVRFALCILAVSAALTLALAGTLGGLHPLISFFLGRTANSYTVGLTTGYVLYGPVLVVPTTFIFMLAFLKRRTYFRGIMLVLCIAVALFVTVPRGDRTNIVAFVLPLIVLWYLRRNKRPRGAQILVVLLLAIFGMNILLAYRTVENRAANPLGKTIANAFLHPGAQVKKFATGVDLGEFSVLELEYEGIHRQINPLTFHPGSTIAAILAGPIPHKLIKSKPIPALLDVTNYVFPNNVQRASFGPSLFGDMFDDFGYLTLVIYSLGVGIGMRFAWEYFRRYSANLGVQIVFAAWLPLLVIMTRDSIGQVIAASVFYVLPLLWCVLRCSKTPKRRLAGSRLRPRTAP